MKSGIAVNWIIMNFSLAVLLFTGIGNLAVGHAQESDAAIKMYDPVAYFKESKAVKGNESFTFNWHGMTWYFSTKEHRDIFAANPEKYAPQYDGYCAWAMSEGRKAITDPEVWRIVNGKLYLNCSRSAYEKWIRDIPGNVEKADANWEKMSGGS